MERISTKGWLLLAAMAAMGPVAAITATAGMADTSTEQNLGESITQDSSSGTESGDVGQTFEVTGSGTTPTSAQGSRAPPTPPPSRAA